jgi:hypothetical protein
MKGHFNGFLKMRNEAEKSKTLKTAPKRAFYQNENLNLKTQKPCPIVPIVPISYLTN